MSDAYAAVVVQTAQFAAALGGQGVHGAAVAAVVHAQELTSAAGAAWAETSIALDRQNVVREAYAVVPEAGSKRFVTDGAVGGEQASPAGPAGSAGRPPLPDPLRIAGRIQLAPGERFVGSGSAKDRDGALMLAAAVDTPDGRQVHIGVPIYEDDRKNWRGGHAPAEETEVDEEDGEEYHVDTGADVTAVLDAADAARMPELVDDVIGRAAAVDKEYRKLNRESERLYAERGRLEAQRFGGEAEGERKISVDWQVRNDERLQRRRRQTMDAAADRLNAEDRARYDELQARVDAAGYDAWEPDREAEMAGVLDLTPQEAREMQALQRIRYPQRTREQRDRLTELDRTRRAGLPPLLAEQAALVCGLTVDEFEEMAALERIPKPSHIDYYYNRRRRVRTEQEQARLDELDASPRGATGADQRETYKLRARYLSSIETHHSSKTELADIRAEQAAMEAAARPLDPAEAAELARITAELDAIDERMDALGGWASATVEIPARNGGALVIEAMQQEEEGGVDYRVERKPADADDEWSPGSGMDPFTTNAAGLRKAAKLVATLAGLSVRQARQLRAGLVADLKASAGN